jgi:hypothetical protein
MTTINKICMESFENLEEKKRESKESKVKYDVKSKPK